MKQLGFFGYGSLVNCATHSFADPRPAQLAGWRRVWRGTHLREVAYLSVEPDNATTLQGLVARVPDTDWAALDAREGAYLRHDVSHLVSHDLPDLQTAVYQVEARHIAPAQAHPILLSYLDVVVQGYLRIFGESGVQHFFETTAGWDTPMLNDRAAPIYPRHQTLTARETALVDDHLAAVVQQTEKPHLTGERL
ncbi:MAG: gamma-glutamylcyclotransferase family protein [Yoonia sp.]|uniref:gamma-glutamylcyclotransferase family protein n=1 Tax=Yoonia sp. TaxID=2212373 RepID=UPI003EF2ACED